MSGVAAQQLAYQTTGCIWQHELADSVGSLIWRNQTEVIVAGADGILSWLNTVDGSVRHTVDAHQGAITRLTINAAENILATASEDGCVKLWDAACGSHLHTLLSHWLWVEQLAWSAQGNYLAAATGRELFIWDKRGEQRQHIGQHSGDFPGSISALDWSQRGARLLAGSYRCVKLLQPDHAKALQHYDCPNGVSSCSWSPRQDGAFAAGSQDKLLQVWRRDRQQRLKQFTMRGYHSKVTALSWRADGRAVVLGTEAGGLYCYHL
jgi:WD40 repeat protein